MTNIDKTLEILSATNDGNLLAPKHLLLTELACNDRLGQEGQVQFDELYAKVKAGAYAAATQYLFGIEHLTRDGSGYVYWKGAHVEHYSHDSADRMHADALRLAENCQALDTRGFPVNARTAICPLLKTAQADTPWREALLRFYALFQQGNRRVGIFYRYEAPEVVVLERDETTGELKTAFLTSAYDAFHFLQDQGLESLAPNDDLDRFCSFMDASKLTALDLRSCLN